MGTATRWTRIACLAGAAVSLVGCGVRRPQGSPAGADPAESVKTTAFGRAELWGMYCARCHNLRPRVEYGPAQWSVVVNHMRAVGDIPGKDYRALLEYLADRRPANAPASFPSPDSGAGSR